MNNSFIDKIATWENEGGAVPAALTILKKNAAHLPAWAEPTGRLPKHRVVPYGGDYARIYSDPAQMLTNYNLSGG